VGRRSGRSVEGIRHEKQLRDANRPAGLGEGSVAAGAADGEEYGAERAAPYGVRASGPGAGGEYQRVADRMRSPILVDGAGAADDVGATALGEEAGAAEAHVFGGGD